MLSQSCYYANDIARRIDEPEFAVRVNFCGSIWCDEGAQSEGCPSLSHLTSNAIPCSTATACSRASLGIKVHFFLQLSASVSIWAQWKFQHLLSVDNKVPVPAALSFGWPALPKKAVGKFELYAWLNMQMSLERCCKSTVARMFSKLDFTQCFYIKDLCVCERDTQVFACVCAV